MIPSMFGDTPFAWILTLLVLGAIGLAALVAAWTGLPFVIAYGWIKGR